MVMITIIIIIIIITIMTIIIIIIVIIIMKITTTIIRCLVSPNIPFTTSLRAWVGLRYLMSRSETDEGVAKDKDFAWLRNQIRDSGSKA